MHRSVTTASSPWTPVLVGTLIAASAILSTSMGIRQSLGLFLDPVARATGISVASFGLAMAVQNLVWGIFQPTMGALSDRYGGHMVVTIGAASFAGGLWLMTLGGALGLYVGGGLLIGIAIAATSHGVLVGVISRLAAPGVRAISISVLAAAGSLGTLVLAPASQAMLDRMPWNTVLLVLAALSAGMVVLALVLRGRRRGQPAAHSERPNALKAIREALRHRGYVAMTVAFFACGFQLIFVATHLPKFVAICGLSPSVSANTIALIGVCNAVGTLLVGYLGERFGNRLVLSLIYVFRTIAIASYAFMPVSVVSTLLFGAAMGLLWLSVIPPVSGLLNNMFGATNFGALFGVMFLSHQIGAFLGAYLGGLTFDLTGDYLIAWSAMIVVGLLAALIQISMDDRPAGTLAPA
ncbi:MFS transporter [Nisaea sediminum]|uniref:MFS transporter n=1 Tax=Nisaea sediminum TaxID=2775867 RepID=UPI00186649E6|nr:MFS transporter [Nisaea sediminum]